MCTQLSNNVQEERLRWVMPIIEKKIKLKDLAVVLRKKNTRKMGIRL